MPKPFPHAYRTVLRLVKEKEALLSSGGAPDILGAPPPEFDGPENRWSPEHLLLASANLCLMTTFLALAGKKGLNILDYEGTAEGVLEKTKNGLEFTRITLRASPEVYAADAVKAEETLKLAKKYCLVSNALKPEVGLKSEIRKA